MGKIKLSLMRFLVSKSGSLLTPIIAGFVATLVAKVAAVDASLAGQAVDFGSNWRGGWRGNWAVFRGRFPWQKRTDKSRANRLRDKNNPPPPFWSTFPIRVRLCLRLMPTPTARVRLL
jgi:uncharacterized protein YgiB involved in biofilm formation